MAEKFFVEQDKENWAKNLDELLNHADVDWTSETTDGVVLQNGFVNARNDKGLVLRLRQLVRRDGTVLATSIYGVIAPPDNWHGEQRTAFSTPVFPVTQPVVLGATASVQASGNYEGTVHVSPAPTEGRVDFTLTGHRIDMNTAIDGWIFLNFIVR